MLNLTGTDFDLKNEGVCYQNLELPHLCIMIRKSLYNPSGSSDVDLDVDLFIPELEWQIRHIGFPSFRDPEEDPEQAELTFGFTENFYTFI